MSYYYWLRRVLSRTNKNQKAPVMSASDADLPGVSAGPVTSQERLTSVDTLRGVAVLGILVMNIYAFAMPFAAYSNPLLMGGTDTLNMGTWFFTHILFDQKFMSIFSMLFGAGLIMMSERAEAKGVKYGRFYFRRQFWLLLIGMLHAYLIWFGDILFVYAWVGMLAYLFRKRSPRFLIILACLLLPVSPLVNYGYSASIAEMQVRVAGITEKQQGSELSDEDREILDDWKATQAFIAPTSESIQKDVVFYTGGYTDNLAHRAPAAVMIQLGSFFVFGIWRIGALMLIGMALMKLRVFSAERSTRFYGNLMLFGYGLGLPLAAYSAIDAYAHQFDGLYMLRVGGIANDFASILTALGHISLIMLMVKYCVWQKALARLAAVGRMALTNYLLHSVILTTVFYGFGFGLYGQVPRFWQMFFVVAMIALQLLVSPWWLNKYRFGPVEWVWRSLSYGKRQPMR
jgi:uncharacterized protein